MIKSDLAFSIKYASTMNLINISKSLDTSNYTLILPSVSVGNIGQLTVDLLISTYNFTKLTSVWDPAIIPSVGGDPFQEDSKDICTACDLYGNDNLKIVVLQLRSSIEYKLANSFFGKLCQSVINLKFKQVLILTSCFDYEKHTVDTGSFRYISNLDQGSLLMFQQLDVTPMNSIMNGAGFASKLYDVLSNANVKCSVIVKYCSEGDNRPDALQMLNILDKTLNIHSILPVFPKSWEFVFGNPPPIGMY